ncbi:kelch-like protein 42 [Acipenser ruthenus]|uniref:kelch-like protein 42 n=1 Tax=Acipenser ruthenus TaxID=7906 RepID=UPI00274091BE|nr:kelch-like protein 42 [Acipenser ruthenus]
MNRLMWCLSLVLIYFILGLKFCGGWVQWVLTVLRSFLFSSVTSGNDSKVSRVVESWERDPASRIYSCGEEDALVTVQTSTHCFQVDLGKLSECSEYFRALSHSRMKETTENLIHLDHISSRAFRNLLEFTFRQPWEVPEEELREHIQVGSYLLAHPFLARCLALLRKVLTPQNCQSYLDFAKSIFCEEMLSTVYCYLSTRLLEMPQLYGSLEPAERERIIELRSEGSHQLCALKKENLCAGRDSQTDEARYLYRFLGAEDSGDWCQGSKLPFLADKWSFSTAVLYNYLFVIGGYRHKVKKGFEFRMASFRYNPFTDCWDSVAHLIKRRRHFSTAVCEGAIFAVGGWYLDNLLAPDSSTALYTAVERYDPWTDTWAFVSSLPLTDFLFTVSLSHDIPLTTVLRDCIYVLGTIQKTGEKLILQYNVKQDSWSELLPTLTCADADIPSLYFFCSVDRLYLIGGNNNENVVTSFCVESQKWGKVRATQKMALAGQGTILNNKVYMPAAEQSTVISMDLHSLSTQILPPLPISTSYEALFHLYFKEFDNESSL